MTGGSGGMTAIPSHRDPLATEVALLPENREVVPVIAEDRLLISRLPPTDDVGLVSDRFVGFGVAFEDATDDCKLCGCHICSRPFPVFSGLPDPSIDQVTFFL